jgi:hypothetical protein
MENRELQQQVSKEAFEKCLGQAEDAGGVCSNPKEWPPAGYLY